MTRGTLPQLLACQSNSRYASLTPVFTTWIASRVNSFTVASKLADHKSLQAIQREFMCGSRAGELDAAGAQSHQSEVESHTTPPPLLKLYPQYSYLAPARVAAPLFLPLGIGVLHPVKPAPPSSLMP